MSKTMLKKYSESLTYHPDDAEMREAYEEWRDLSGPEYEEDFRVLESPKNWEELFKAMMELHYTQSDVLEHIQELRRAGEMDLANAIEASAMSTHSFTLMERG